MKFYKRLLPFLFIFLPVFGQEDISMLYQKLESSFSPEVLACRAQQRNMDSAYKLIAKPGSTLEEIEFTRDEKKILNILIAFHAQDIVGPKHQTHFRNMIFSNCTEENLDRYAILERQRLRCDSSFSQLNFMQGLAIALEKNDWSVATEKLAKEKMISYLKNMSSVKTFLSHRIIALSILTEMYKNGIISNSLAAKIKETKSKEDSPN